MVGECITSRAVTSDTAAEVAGSSGVSFSTPSSFTVRARPVDSFIVRARPVGPSREDRI